MESLLILARDGFNFSLEDTREHDTRVNVFTDSEEFVLWFAGIKEATIFAHLATKIAGVYFVEVNGKPID